MILKKGLLTELKENFKKKILRKAIIFLDRACFGWVGTSMSNQHFFKVGLIKKILETKNSTTNSLIFLLRKNTIFSINK